MAARWTLEERETLREAMGRHSHRGLHESSRVIASEGILERSEHGIHAQMRRILWCEYPTARDDPLSILAEIASRAEPAKVPSPYVSYGQKLNYRANSPLHLVWDDQARAHALGKLGGAS